MLNGSDRDQALLRPPRHVLQERLNRCADRLEHWADQVELELSQRLRDVTWEIRKIVRSL